MQAFAIVLVAVGALITPFYFHALVNFRRILLAERPDLAERRGSLSFFYSGMPRIADPNVGAAVVAAAFGPVARELQNQNAMRYARRIRLSLLVGVPAIPGRVRDPDIGCALTTHSSRCRSATRLSSGVRPASNFREYRR